jgi:hypothetical protein
MTHVRLVPVEKRVNAGAARSVGATGTIVHKGEQGVNETQSHGVEEVKEAQGMRRDHQVGKHQHRVHDVAVDVAKVKSVQICKIAEFFNVSFRIFSPIYAKKYIPLLYTLVQ